MVRGDSIALTYLISRSRRRLLCGIRCPFAAAPTYPGSPARRFPPSFI